MKTSYLVLAVMIFLFTACGGGGSSASPENEKNIDTRQSAINAYVSNFEAVDDLENLVSFLDEIIYHWSVVTTVDLSRSYKRDVHESRIDLVKNIRSVLAVRGAVENDVVECPKGGTMTANGNAVSTNAEYEYALNIVFDHCYMDTTGYLSGAINYHDKDNTDTYDVETEFVNFTIATGLPDESRINGRLIEQYISMDSKNMTFDGTVSNDDSSAIYKNYKTNVNDNLWEVEGQIDMSSSSYTCIAGVYNVQTPKAFRSDSYNGVITINNATYTLPDAPSETTPAPSLERKVANGTDIIKVQFNGETVDVLKNEFEYACSGL